MSIWPTTTGFGLALLVRLRLAVRVTVSMSDALLQGGLATLQVGSITPAGGVIVAVFVTDVCANAELAESANTAISAKDLN